MSLHMMKAALPWTVVVMVQLWQVQVRHLVLVPHDSCPGHTQILG